MKTLRTTMAVALLGLALTAFQSSALAQARRGGSGSSSTTSRSVSNSQSSRSSASSSKRSENKAVKRTSTGSSTDKKTVRTTTGKSSAVQKTTGSQTSRPTSGSQTRPAYENKATRPASGSQVTRPTASSSSESRVTRPAPGTSARPAKPQTKPADKDKKPSAVTRPVNRPSDRKPGGEDVRPGKPVSIRPDHKPDRHRQHPRDRDFMHYSKPSYYWTAHNHCYGHRVRMLPSHALRHIFHGITYYCYNDIWYRPYAGHYVVCRPPYGTILAANLIADMTWASIRFSYYNTVARTYDQINENYEYIAQQNAIIAQNNAVIAAQNAQIAQGQQQAVEAYSLASQLGLYQSYAAADGSYFYQDGVFYAIDANGQYSVIVPPAGALVETLPEDYDMVVLADGNEYYKVDDTVYRVTVVEGKPYFEVLGQLYS